jgi:hypothetical protein
MKKNSLCGAALLLTAAIVLTGCFSMPKNAKEITDFSSVPAKSSEQTPLEGTWHGVGKASFLTLTQEYAFSGNQFVFAADMGTYTGTRGVFDLVGNAFALYTLEIWDSANSTWKALPYTIGGYRNPAQIITNTLTLNGDQFTLSNEDNSIVFSKIDVPTIVLKEITARDVAQTYGLALGDNESLITIERITESGMQTRIGEPDEWKIYIDGALAKTINKRQTIAFTVPNGTHTMYVDMGTLGLANIEYKSKELAFNAQSNYISLSTYLEGKLKPDVILKQK